jgi:hypothetical protein
MGTRARVSTGLPRGRAAAIYSAAMTAVPPGSAPEPLPPLSPAGDFEPVYPDESAGAVASPAPTASSAAPLAWWRARRWQLVALAGLVVVGVVVALVVALTRSGSSPPPARGARTAQAAAQQFLAAIRAGKGTAAVAVSCASFADEARGAAHTAHLNGFTFSLGAVHASGPSATAALIQKVDVGGTTQRMVYQLYLERNHSRWLVCGRS